MTVPCEGQLLLMTPPFDGLVPEPIVLGTMSACPGLFDEHGKQVSTLKNLCFNSCSCLLFSTHDLMYGGMLFQIQLICKDMLLCLRPASAKF